MIIDTDEIIRSRFPSALSTARSAWERLYPNSYNSYDGCPWHFFCKYFSGMTVEPTPALVLGGQCHHFIENYFLTVKVRRLHELVLSGDKDAVTNFILGYFKDVAVTTDQKKIMSGFAAMESDRAFWIVESCGKNLKTFMEYYIPLYVEETIKAGFIAGRLDCIFKIAPDACAPLDWKTGKKPKITNGKAELYESITNQVHIYGMLLDASGIKHKGKILAPTHYLIAYPKSKYIVFEKFDQSIKDAIFDSVQEYLDAINSNFFPMKIAPDTCGYMKGFFKCEFFDLICKDIMINDLGYTINDKGEVIIP